MGSSRFETPYARPAPTAPSTVAPGSPTSSSSPPHIDSSPRSAAPKWAPTCRLCPRSAAVSRSPQDVRTAPRPSDAPGAPATISRQPSPSRSVVTTAAPSRAPACTLWPNADADQHLPRARLAQRRLAPDITKDDHGTGVHAAAYVVGGQPDHQVDAGLHLAVPEAAALTAAGAAATGGHRRGDQHGRHRCDRGRNPRSSRSSTRRSSTFGARRGVHDRHPVCCAPGVVRPPSSAPISKDASGTGDGWQARRRSRADAAPQRWAQAGTISGWPAHTVAVVRPVGLLDARDRLRAGRRRAGRRERSATGSPPAGPSQCGSRRHRLSSRRVPPAAGAPSAWMTAPITSASTVSAMSSASRPGG